MRSRHISACGFVILAASVSALGQGSGNGFTALKLALGLSDAQVSQLQQMPPPTIAKPEAGGPGPTAIYSADRRLAGGFSSRIAIQATQNEDALRILDDSQRDKLTAIKKLLDRWDEAAVTVGLGFIE